MINIFFTILGLIFGGIVIIAITLERIRETFNEIKEIFKDKEIRETFKNNNITKKES